MKWLTTQPSSASTLKICRLRDPHRDICIKSSIQNLLPELKNNPKYFTPLEPLNYESINIQLKNSLMTGAFGIKDIKAIGMSTAQIKNVKSQFNDFGMKLRLDLFFPKLSVTSAYNSNMFLAGIKILSEGKFDVKLSDVKSKWTMKGKLINKDGEQFMEIYETDIELDINDADVALTGVFESHILSEFSF